jgi:hypothetical protein
MKVAIQTRNFSIRLLFIILILWMPLQYAITARYGEPYPALVMPSFAGTRTDRNGNIRIMNVKCKVLFRDGRVAWTSEYDLLSEVPSAYHDAIMRHMFGPIVKAPEPSPHRIAVLLSPGRVLSRYREAHKELDPQTKQWLKRRVMALYPSQTVTALSFVWYIDIFNLKQVPAIRAHEPLGMREVRFQ